MNEPVVNLENRDRRRTDILHEYFVPPERFNEFIEGCREIIPKAKAEFLNVTLRYVLKDDTSVLSFAPTDRIAAVMSFSQEITPEGEADMIVHHRGADRSASLASAAATTCPTACMRGPIRSPRSIRTQRASPSARSTTIPGCCSATRCGTPISHRS